MNRDLLGDGLYFMLIFGFIFLFVWFLQEAWNSWKGYLKQRFQLEQDRIVLDIRIPREITKTPQAMELVFNGLFEPSEGNWWSYITTGETRAQFSFEMASIGGEVHFYIWAPRGQKNRIEAHVYAQYPEVQIVEVPDYTQMIAYSTDTHKAFGFEFKLGQADPIPIKTYRHLGLDKAGIKPEEQIDPITQTIESMAQVGPHEQMWFQIVARAHLGSKSTKAGIGERIAAFFKIPFSGSTEEMNKKLNLFLNGRVVYSWKKEGQKIVDEIRENYRPKEGGSMENMTRGDQLRIEAIQENLSKPAFDVGIRSIYVAPKEHYNGSMNGVMGSMFKQLGSGDIYNDLRPGLVPKVSYPWQDRSGRMRAEMIDDLMKNYRRRKYLLEGIKHYKYGKEGFATFTMSSEELATLYHLPGQVAQTPSFDRIDSTTGQAPANLPI